MKYSFLFTGLLAMCSLSSWAQADSADIVAKKFMRTGDFENAVVVLTHGLQQYPDNLTLLKDLAFTYYLQKNYASAIATAKPLTERKDADVESYQILGMAYNGSDERKECEKMYKQGIKRFPNSGALYNEYGELLWSRKDNGAISLWEKGIELDPDYSSNYYNACRYYYSTPDKIWSLLYGEIFVNLESYSQRTVEIKDLMYDGYRKLFSDPNLLKAQNAKNPFLAAYITEINKQSSAISKGLSIEALTLLRKNLAIDWAATMQGKYPFRLIDYHNQLIKQGLFDGYNQWFFHAINNDPEIKTWNDAHADEFNRFISFQKGRVFKIPEGQYYRTLK